MLPPDHEDLERLVYERVIRLEITGGIPTWEAFPSARHQHLIDRIRATIAPAEATAEDCGCFHLADTLFRFPDGSRKRPDIAIFCQEPPYLDEALTIIPDAVIEIVSPGYEYKDVTLNPPFYLGQGVRDVVIYDPATARLTHHTRAGATERAAPADLTLTCGCACTIPV